jgi:nicotinamidase-related amidase
MELNYTATALLVMDMQTAIIQNLPDSEKLVNNVAKAISFARAGNIPVIYVTIGFRPGMPEISRNNKGFSATKERLLKTTMESWMKIEDKVAPLPGDIIVVKRRVSAFTGSDLDVVLRSNGIQQIILTGVATSGVVLSTLREAADKDFKIVVFSDCCADGDPEVHRVLTTKVFPRQAEVISVDDLS